MKLQYLGTAAAEAIPAVFCVCRTCRDAREKGGRNIRTRSQAIVNDSLLIDYPCDAYIHSIQNGIDYSGIHHCLITHIHADHLYPSDFEYLRSGFCKLPEDYEGFHLYGSVDVEAKVAKIAERTNGKLVFHCIKPFEPFFIGEMKVTALKALHGTPNPYIYLIENNGTALLYAIREIYPNDFALRQPEDEKALLPINRLTGSDVLAHDWPDFDALMERWENEAKAFDERAAFARMYE